MASKKYTSPKSQDFYYTIESRSSKQVSLGIWEGNECKANRYHTRGDEESIDRFIIRMHSLGLIEVQKLLDDKNEYDFLKKRLDHESLIKAGKLKNDMEIE